MRLLPSGSRGVLLEVEDTAAASRWYQLLRRTQQRGELPGVEDLVPAARTVLLALHRGTDPSTVSAAVSALSGHTDLNPSSSTGSSETDVLRIRVRYDGPDLDAAARALDVTVPALIERHQEEGWTVAFCGFAPGFGYLTGVRHRWEAPRLESPRAKVPAGAVALAGPYTGVYPRSSPGGWLIIGHTDATLFDVQRTPPALLSPGVQVSFVEADS